MKNKYIDKVNIYCLKDPTTNTVFYVGQTVCTLEKRLKGHISKERRIGFVRGSIERKSKWIKEMLNKGIEPTIELIEQCRPGEHLERELYWIKYHRNLNPDLKNVADLRWK